VLTAAENQRLSFARIILFCPRWILLGDATTALDPASADLMLRLIVEQLPQAGIVLIGRHPGSAEIFNRQLTLEKAADGEILLQEVHARRQAARQPRPRLPSFIDRLRQGYDR
jgi:putative ATP-binding cassette transporter